MSLTDSNPQLNQDFKLLFQGLFEDELIAEIEEYGKVYEMPANTVLVDIGENIKFLPIILQGSLKVFTEDEQGKELFLYYIERGETCAISVNCCTVHSNSKVRAYSDDDTTMLFIPPEKVEEWMVKYHGWRSFILDVFNSRINELVGAIDSLAFNNMEERTYRYLRDKAMIDGETRLHTTHSQVANDLHSSRVVISRVLKKLELDGLIKTHRNAIEIIKM